MSLPRRSPDRPPCCTPRRLLCRRDSIDATHYPVFHQMEGVRVFSPADWQASGMEATQYAETELKRTLEGLAQHLFGELQESVSVLSTAPALLCWCNNWCLPPTS